MEAIANYGSFWLMAISGAAFVIGLWYDTFGPGAEVPFSHESKSHIGCLVALVSIVFIVVGVIWTLVGRYFGFVTWTIPIPPLPGP